MNFVIVDLDMKRPAAQQDLVNKYYRGYIPHVTVLDKSGKPVYNNSGEVEEGKISSVLDAALQ